MMTRLFRLFPLNAQLWSARGWACILVLVALAVALPGFFLIPPVDRDEARFAQSTRQMVGTGDYVDIRFQDGTRYKKPVGIYWLQSLAVHAVSPFLGTDAEAPIWAYRIPSLIGFVTAVLATYWMACIFLSRYAAGLSAFLFALAVLPGVEARIAKTDAVLLALIVLAQAVVARLWSHPTIKLTVLSHFIFWALVGGGVLLKGPIILLVCGSTLLSLSVLDRSFDLLRGLRPVTGVIISLLIILPWFVAIGFKSEGAFFVEAGLVDFLSKVTSVKESHGGPPGIYTAVMAATFWPASLFLLCALPVLVRYRREKAVVFALCWALPSWLIFELTPTKLPHYVLPLFPALALLVGLSLEKGLRFTTLFQKLLFSLVFVMPVLLGVVAVGLVYHLEGVFSPGAVIFILIAAFFGICAWKFSLGEGALANTRPFLFLLLTAIPLYLAVYQFTFPKLETIWISNRLVNALEETGNREHCPAPSVMAVGYHEPSLAFLGPLDLRFEGVSGAVQKLQAAPCRRLFLTKRHEAGFLSELGKSGLKLKPLATVTGFTLNGGDDVSITLYETENTVRRNNADF